MPLLRKPKSNDMCPPGYHVVRGHLRICASGTKTWVDTHIRQNPRSKTQMLLAENLIYLYWNSEKHYPKLNPIKGFKGFHELDSVIQFWLDYWKSQGLSIPNLDPLIIKAMIAAESSFNPNAQGKGSSALGLMQITHYYSRKPEGERYAKKIFKLYEASK